MVCCSLQRSDLLLCGHGILATTGINVTSFNACHIRLGFLSQAVSKTRANRRLHTLDEYIFHQFFMIYTAYSTSFASKSSFYCCAVMFAGPRMIKWQSPILQSLGLLQTCLASTSQILGTIASVAGSSVQISHWGVGMRNFVRSAHMTTKCIYECLADTIGKDPHCCFFNATAGIARKFKYCLASNDWYKNFGLMKVRL